MEVSKMEIVPSSVQDERLEGQADECDDSPRKEDSNIDSVSDDAGNAKTEENEAGQHDDDGTEKTDVPVANSALDTTGSSEKQEDDSEGPDDIGALSLADGLMSASTEGTMDDESPTKRDVNLTDLEAHKKLEIRLSRLPDHKQQETEKESVSSSSPPKLPRHRPTVYKRIYPLSYNFASSSSSSSVRTSSTSSSKSSSSPRTSSTSSKPSSSTSSRASESESDKTSVKRKQLPVKRKKIMTKLPFPQSSTNQSSANRVRTMAERKAYNTSPIKRKKSTKPYGPVKIKINFLTRKLAKTIEEEPEVEPPKPIKIDFETIEQEAFTQAAEKWSESCKLKAEEELAEVKNDPRFAVPCFPSTPDGSSESSSDDDSGFRRVPKVPDPAVLKASQTQIRRTVPKRKSRKRGRRTMMKRAMVRKGIRPSLSESEKIDVSFGRSFFHDMTYYQIGDIVAIDQPTGPSPYFAQILNLVEFENAERYAEIAWLVPTTYCDAYPFNPKNYERRYDIAPQLYHMDEVKFVTHFPFNYYDRTLEEPRELGDYEELLCNHHHLPIRMFAESEPAAVIQVTEESEGDHDDSEFFKIETFEESEDDKEEDSSESEFDSPQRTQNFETRGHEDSDSEREQHSDTEMVSNQNPQAQDADYSPSEDEHQVPETDQTPTDSSTLESSPTKSL